MSNYDVVKAVAGLYKFGFLLSLAGALVFVDGTKLLEALLKLDEVGLVHN